MSDPPSTGAQPGDRPPSSPSATPKLDRPPSDRYRARGQGSPAGTGTSAPAAGRSFAGALGAAVGVAVAGALALAVILGVILVTTGTFVVSLLAGGAIGLLVSGTSVGPAPVMTRGRTMRIAIGLALGMVALAGIATWLLARSEGGVMDPISYLWTTFGLGIPAQAVVAVLAAAWGAASGPVRWRE
ncbi:MAG: hypothetical protein HY264_05610 [Chloroflexi bacterium]|nr:hypothetical protein [Chloroflexota bacterium]